MKYDICFDVENQLSLDIASDSSELQKNRTRNCRPTANRFDNVSFNLWLIHVRYNSMTKDGGQWKVDPFKTDVPIVQAPLQIQGIQLSAGSLCVWTLLQGSRYSVSIGRVHKKLPWAGECKTTFQTEFTKKFMLLLIWQSTTFWIGSQSRRVDRNGHYLPYRQNIPWGVLV